MHAIQGAIAIRREREKREKRRQSKIERSNSKSPRNSDVSNVEKGEGRPVAEPPKPPKPESSLTAFHLGVVFILLGFLMVFSAMITNSMVEGDWSHLLGRVLHMVTGHSVHEVHGFEFLAKTILANNLKTVDWMVVDYDYLSLA